MKARRMEDEICQLQKSLEERNEQVQESASIAKQVSILSTLMGYVSFVYCQL